jgi:molybdopterin-guanine dinucleotide biosynthesis protein A
VLKIRNNSKYLAITLLIGGKSTRFGSDKGLYEILGKPLISYLLNTLDQIDYNIFLVAHSYKQAQNYINKIDIKRIKAIIIDDRELLSRVKEKSPMIGLYSAFKELNKLNYEKTLILPCDTPLVQKNVIEFLVEQSKGFDCCIPQWDNGLIEPLFAIYPVKKSFRSTKKNLNKNHFKLSGLLKKDWRIRYVSIERSIQTIDKNLLSFININKLSDLERINKYLEKKV